MSHFLLLLKGLCGGSFLGTHGRVEVQRGAAVVCSQRTGPKGIKLAGGGCRGIFSQEDIDSPGRNSGELVRNDSVVSERSYLLMGTDPCCLGTLWGRSWGAPAVECENGQDGCVFLLQIPVLRQEYTGF